MRSVRSSCKLHACQACYSDARLLGARCFIALIKVPSGTYGAADGCGTTIALDREGTLQGEDTPGQVIDRSVADAGDPDGARPLGDRDVLSPGGNIDVILRENYTSILAAEGMKEAIERMDSGLCSRLEDASSYGREQFDGESPQFEASLKTEKGISRSPGNRRWSILSRRCFATTSCMRDQFFEPLPATTVRGLFQRAVAGVRQDPRSARTRFSALNQENMTAMDRRASHQRDQLDPADGRVRSIAAVILAVGRRLHLSRSILRPIQAVTDGARAMARGELDQLVPAASRDELGDLANAFNEMARTLRDYRQAGTARLLRAAEDRPGDDRLVPRSGGGRRPGRLG